MNSGLIDISSDEETGQRGDLDDDSADWLSNLIESAEAKLEDDSDDVVVIGEVNSGSKCDDDDDCVVLDGDPDKVVSVAEDESGNGSDDLVVVGEKGQIACRDYPHPRHLCAKFPFTSSPHEKHCDQCHCYVCDSLAPCVHWGTGASHIGHCHATEKVEMWKVLRRSFKMGRSASMPAIVPSLDIIRLAPNSVPQTQVCRPPMTHAISSVSRTVPAPTTIPLNRVPRSTLIRACPSTRVINSTVRNPSRSHQPRSHSSKDGVQPSSASQQSPSNALRSGRAHNTGHGGLHRTSAPIAFKKVGAGAVRGPPANNRPAYVPTYNSNFVNPSQYGPLNNSGFDNPSQYGRTTSPNPPMTASNDGVRFSWQEVHNSLNQIPSLPIGSDIVGSAYPPQHPQIYNHSIPQSAYSQSVQPGNQIQNDGQNIHQYGIQSQNVSENVSLQGVGPSAVDLGFSDCNYSWMNNSSQSIQQAQPPIQNSQVQTTPATHGPSPVKEPDFESDIYPHLKGLESDFDNWLMDNQPVPPVTNDSMPSQMDLLSPGPPLADAGMLLFDFETSFNSLTQV